MAFTFSNGGRSRLRGTPPLSEMNIVPLVDVVLVLLIIFMITAQAMEFGLEIDVPKVKQERASAEDLPVVSVTRSGEIYLGDKPVNINQLGEQIRRQYGKRGTAAYLRGDSAANWGVCVQVADALSREKIEVRVVTRTDDRSLPR
jgi:biopolymer transport protein ExbD